MNVPPEVVEVLRQWVRKAEHDLEAASRIMAIEEGCPFDTVCFHCQQAAEKYLKCLLTYLGIQAPRTHDLKALAALIHVERRFPVPVEDLAERLEAVLEELTALQAEKKTESEKAEVRVCLTEPQARLMKHGDNADRKISGNTAANLEKPNSFSA
jgi:HEPN domain-containing protein